MNVVNDIVDLIAETIEDNVDDAANCSHRPENVRYWLDANSRYFLASRITEALGFRAANAIDTYPPATTTTGGTP